MGRIVRLIVWLWARDMDVTELLDTMEYGPAPESRAAVDAWLAANREKAS